MMQDKGFKYQKTFVSLILSYLHILKVFGLKQLTPFSPLNSLKSLGISGRLSLLYN